MGDDQRKLEGTRREIPAGDPAEFVAVYQILTSVYQFDYDSDGFMYLSNIHKRSSESKMSR